MIEFNENISKHFVEFFATCTRGIINLHGLRD